MVLVSLFMFASAPAWAVIIDITVLAATLAMLRKEEKHS